MLIVGIDVASKLANCGYAIGIWNSGQIQIQRAGLLEEAGQMNGLRDVIAPLMRSSDPVLLALDAPLGWPAPLGKTLAAHQAGGPITVAKDAMFARNTDRFVRKRTGQIPLEVGADKIARAAHAALNILQSLREASGEELPMAWQASLCQSAAIEVYPAATLRASGLPHSGYKDNQKDRDLMLAKRKRIASGFGIRVTGLDEFTDKQDDVFDACLCLVAAGDFLEGRAMPPDDIALAVSEGWIWVRSPAETSAE